MGLFEKTYFDQINEPIPPKPTPHPEVIYADEAYLWKWAAKEVVETFGAEFVKEAEKSKSAYAVAGSLAVADGPAPIGDGMGVAIATTSILYNVAVALYNTGKAIDNPIVKEKDITLTLPREKDDKKEVYFPVNPYEFMPKGCEITLDSRGTKNGAIIKWSDSVTGLEVFEWNENSTKSDGAHYHVLQEPFVGKNRNHYYPPTQIPEPWASIYF